MKFVKTLFAVKLNIGNNFFGQKLININIFFVFLDLGDKLKKCRSNGKTAIN